MFSRFVSDFSFSLKVLLAGHRTTSASLVCQDILSAFAEGTPNREEQPFIWFKRIWGVDLFVGFFGAEIVVPFIH